MVHVAILLKPYLELILRGEKTVECRLTRQARAPFESIEPGERIYFKQSAGPYAVTAVADHVLFEDDLTPRRVRELRRDYNEFIRGDDAFWKPKRDATYATLIWLRDVEPIDTGPGIRPLRGLAWVTLEDAADDGAARRRGARSKAVPPPLSFSIEITEGNVRNNSLYVTKVLDRFPASSIGGPNRSGAAAPVTLLLRDGPRIETDIVGPRKLFRTRCWGRWFETVGAGAGDHVVFTPIDEHTYFVGVRKQRNPAAPPGRYTPKRR